MTVVELDLQNAKSNGVLFKEKNGIHKYISKEELLEECEKENGELRDLILLQDNKINVLEEKIKKMEEKLNKFYEVFK